MTVQSFAVLSDALIPHAHPIMPFLWLGDEVAGRRARTLPEFDVLNVREELLEELGGICVARGDGHLLPDGLNQAADWIAARWLLCGEDRHILVHCHAGLDRSPMCIVWFLRRQFGMTMDDAYFWVRIHRQGRANDRRDWLPE